MPEFLLLDEPASNIDERGARAFEETLLRLQEEHNLSTLLVAHDLSMVLRTAHRVTGLAGRVTYDGPPDALHDPDVLARAFGSRG
jgi:ABC-type Mn2+/Zn2+ transport system ATPase subunit